MKKEEYKAPALQIIIIKTTDIITLSNGDTDEAEI